MLSLSTPHHTTRVRAVMGGTSSTTAETSGEVSANDMTSGDVSELSSSGGVFRDGSETKTDENADTSGYAIAISPYTPTDQTWLKTGPQSKALDPLLEILYVGARHPTTNNPTVLVCYPLRVAQDLNRSSTKGYSTNKWNPKVGSQPVPWPNTFWLCCPDVIGKIGKLEHSGLIKKFNARFRWPEKEEDLEAAARDAEQFAKQHTNYAEFRWNLLSEADKAYSLENGYDEILRKCGVGGLRVPQQVKCLHLHYAHYLATGDNMVGEWCQQELDKEGTT